jgi:hypothetical protein
LVVTLTSPGYLARASRPGDRRPAARRPQPTAAHILLAMANPTDGGTELGPLAVERAEWRAQSDLGATVPGTSPTAGVPGPAPLGDFDPPGHWRRYLRGAHPPRFRAPGGVEVVAVGPGDAESFGATAAFGLRLPARTEAVFAALPDLPGWRCYLTRSGSAPAAAATFADGPIALIAVDATAEVGRRSPSHAALLHRALGDAIEAGARLIGARIDEEDGGRDAAAGLLLAGFKKSYRCPRWVDAGLPAS